MQPMLVLPLVRGPRLAGSGNRALRNWKMCIRDRPQPNHYGDTTAALAALCITYEDGHEEWIGTDESLSLIHI